MDWKKMRLEEETLTYAILMTLSTTLIVEKANSYNRTQETQWKNGTGFKDKNIKLLTKGTTTTVVLEMII